MYNHVTVAVSSRRILQDVLCIEETKGTDLEKAERSPPRVTALAVIFACGCCQVSTPKLWIARWLRSFRSEP
jgi:hypothetical protein